MKSRRFTRSPPPRVRGASAGSIGPRSRPSFQPPPRDLAFPAHGADDGPFHLVTRKGDDFPLLLSPVPGGPSPTLNFVRQHLICHGIRAVEGIASSDDCRIL